MLTLRDHRSGDLFAPWEHLGLQRRRLLEQGWSGVFRDYLLKHLPVKELSASFQDDFGRPSKDLYVALNTLILQQLHDLTDQQTTEAVALNIAWHYALDIRREADAYLCERTLRNYRSKILMLGLDEVLFRTLTDQLIAAVGVDSCFAAASRRANSRCQAKNDACETPRWVQYRRTDWSLPGWPSTTCRQSRSFSPLRRGLCWCMLSSPNVMFVTTSG